MLRTFSTKQYVYTILSLKTLTIYTGITTDLRRRLDEHSRGMVSGTNIRIPFKLVHYEYFVNHEDAKNRLHFLTTLEGHTKLKKLLQKTIREFKNMPYRVQK